MDRDLNRIANIRAWRAFARSAGILVTLMFTLLTKNPIDSLGKGIIVWLIFYVIRELDYQFVGRNIWSCCSPIVLIVSFWPIRSLFVVATAILSINNGVEVGPVLLVLGGLVVYDLFFVLSYGS
jgi:hypothetical protein